MVWSVPVSMLFFGIFSLNSKLKGTPTARRRHDAGRTEGPAEARASTLHTGFRRSGWLRSGRRMNPRRSAMSPPRTVHVFVWHSRVSGLSSSVGRLTCERVWLAVAPPATLTQGERKEAEKLWMLFTPAKFILALQSSDFHDAKVLKKESLSLKLILIYTYLLQVNFRVK